LRGEMPPALRQTLALHLIDTIGAWIATAATAEARALKTFRAEQHGLAGNARDPALDVMINCALVRLSEIDDIHLASMTTPGAIVIPAVLTIAASLPANAGTLAAAILAGYEAMTRLGAAIDGPRVLYRGMWPSYMAAPFGVAAAAARLFDLSAATTAHALALALALSAPGVGYHSAPTTSRWLAAGSAARNGLLAAQAARAGLTADLAILDGPFLAGVYGITADAAALTEGLGQGPKLAEVAFKPWCAARQTMAATQAFKEIIEGGVAVGDIVAIEAAVPPLFVKMVDHGVAAADRLSRLTSQHYQIAVAALAPELAFDVGQAGAVPPVVQAFMDKITVRADEGLVEGFPRRWSARVRVRTGAALHERLVAHVPGDPERPLTDRQIGEKFQRITRMANEEATAVIEAARGLIGRRRTPAQVMAMIEKACSRAAR